MRIFTVIADLGKLMMFVGLCMAVFFGGMYMAERLIEKLAKNLPVVLKAGAQAVSALLSLGAFLWIFGSFYEF